MGRRAEAGRIRDVCRWQAVRAGVRVRRGEALRPPFGAGGLHLLGEAPKIVRWNRLRARPRLGAPPQTPSPQTFPAGGALRGGMRVDCWRREDGESGEPLSTEALTKGLSEPWREALATWGKIFSVRNVATPVLQ